MPKTSRIASHAIVLAPFVAAGALALAGCAGDDSTSDSAPAAAPAALARGARGHEVREVFDYLRRHGYFANETLAARYPGWQPAVAREPADAEVFDDAIEEGVRLLQRSLGLPETGVVDDETRRLMSLPRCSMPDNFTPPPIRRPSPGPSYFTTNGFKWGQSWGDTTITFSYSGENLRTDVGGDFIEQDLTIKTAMNQWHSTSIVSFSRQFSTSVDLLLGWHSGDHGDGAPFDGAGGAYSHTLFDAGQQKVHLHYDNAEVWRSKVNVDAQNLGYTWVDTQSITLHELGHILGLGHSTNTSSVMYAVYTGIRTSLTDDDRAGIWSLYPAFNPPANACGTIGPVQGLSAGQSFYSCDGRFRLTIQTDGNLVLYQGTKVLWSPSIQNKGGDRLLLQGDGNLVVYRSNGSAVWATGTNSGPNPSTSANHLDVQNDGNLVLYSAANTPLWASNTCCR
ncbi:MAG: matrixin family metalloprotease [Minicystis sp.]